MKSIVIVCTAAILAIGLSLAQPLPPVFNTMQLPSGETRPIYALAAHEGVSPVAPIHREQRSRKANMTHYDGLIYPTQDRVFFATPIDEDAYYLITGVSGVYDDTADLTAGPAAQPDVTCVPLMGVDTPQTFVFHAQPGQIWASQVLLDGSRTDPGDNPKTLRARAAAVKAEPLGAGDTVSANLADAAPEALFSMDVLVGEGYQLSLDCTGDADYDLYLLRPVSNTATVITDASVSRLIHASENAEQLWLVPQEGEEYLVLVRHVSGEGEFSLECEKLDGPPPKPEWTVIKDDDGEQDSYWGQVTSPVAKLHKILVLKDDPADISRAVVQYCMGTEPYDPGSQKALGRGAPEDKEWPNLLVTLNETEILRRPVDEVATHGWHEIAVDPSLLNRGENTVTFALEERGAFFYMSIDLDAGGGRSYCTRGGEVMPDTLRPTPNRYVGPGEYMVRLKYR
ncbi:MAG: hypothetical protein ACLFWB_07175 [Armatimonadota bacterium]